MRLITCNAFLACFCAAILSAPVSAATPNTLHNPADGVVMMYGAGGPHTAYQRAAKLFEKKTGTKVVITAGPEGKWTEDAKAKADLLWGTSEQALTAFLQTYKAFDTKTVEPLYIRRSVILVQKGNPKHISGIADLMKPGIRIVVTEGAGVANTSGTGVWEDVAGRLGNVEDVALFRRNIVAYEHGSGASFRAFKDPVKNVDAWVTWPEWHANNPQAGDLVEIEPARRIYRVTSIVLSPKADPQAKRFAAFLRTAEVEAIFRSEGWQR
ncbi:MAG: substrate-binding domain-containing protein [Luteimonas sp.]